MLMLLSAFLLAMSARIIDDLFRSMYAEATLPSLTQFYLSAKYWALAIPLAYLFPSLIAWKRKGDIGLQYITLVSHFLSVIMMFLVVFGILFPILTTTFRLSQ